MYVTSFSCSALPHMAVVSGTGQGVYASFDFPYNYFRPLVYPLIP